MKQKNGRAGIGGGIARRFIGLCVPLAMAAGCGTDILDVGVDLSPQTYSADFGTTQGTIPTVACDPAQADACGAGAGSVQTSTNGGTAEAHMACDASTMRCYAAVQGSQSFPINVLQEDDFVTKVKRFAVPIVKSVDVSYRVPANSLTFDVPEIRVSAGPAGAQIEGDAGVVPIGTTARVTAGTTIADPAGHLVLADGSAAKALIEDAVQNKKTFVIIAALAPRIEAGAPIPSGQLQVVLSPHLTIGP